MAEKSTAGLKLLADLAAKRHEIVTVQEEIEWVQTAPIPKQELKERATALVRQFASRSELDSKLNALACSQAGNFEFDALLKIDLPIQHGVAPIGASLGPLLCGLMGDIVQAQLFARIDALDYVAGPAMAERPAKFNELTETLRRLEADEEALVCRAEELGLTVARREDADPAVVLGYDPKGNMPELTCIPKIPRPAVVLQ